MGKVEKNANAIPIVKPLDRPNFSKMVRWVLCKTATVISKGMVVSAYVTICPAAFDCRRSVTSFCMDEKKFASIKK
jgi:hypothetical protein